MTKPEFEFETVDMEEYLDEISPKPLELSLEMKLDTVFQQFVNDLYESMSERRDFNIDVIEKHLIKNLSNQFTYTDTARLMGMSVRAIRNKRVAFGLKQAI